MNAEPAGAPRLLVRNGGARHVVRMMVRRGAREELAALIRTHFSLELPGSPQCVGHESSVIVCVAPGSWLVMDPLLSPGFMTRLKSAVAGAASLCDSSDAYLFRQVVGSAARTCLAKLLSIDLHATRFPFGSAAATKAAHVPVMLWRLADEQEHPVFEMAVPRSYAHHVYEALEHAAAAFQVGR